MGISSGLAAIVAGDDITVSAAGGKGHGIGRLALLPIASASAFARDELPSYDERLWLGCRFAR
jgi:hypothetical protein